MFNDIRVTKDGRDYRVPSFIVRAGDVFKKHEGIKQPLICHTKKGQLACYDDGTYHFSFTKNQFTGFRTSDGRVSYDEKEKKFSIKHPIPIRPEDSLITIQLKKRSVSIRNGSIEKELDSISAQFLDMNGFTLKLHGGKGIHDSIMFIAGEKIFLLEINTWMAKSWSWDIIERHDSSFFYINYHYKKKRPESIGIQDQRLHYGMSLLTRFHSQKSVWWIESIFSEPREYGEHTVFSPVKLTPSYSYRYSRFRKLKRKSVNGEIRYCECK